MNTFAKRWNKLPTWAKVLVIILVIPGFIAVARITLEAHFSKLTTMLILLPVLIIFSWPMMFKSKGDRK